MRKTYILVSAVLFTLAALFWGFNLAAALKAEAGWPLMSTIVVLTFVALAGIYWVMYFRRSQSQTSGTE